MSAILTRRASFAALVENYHNDFSNSGKHSLHFIRRVLESGKKEALNATPAMTSTAGGAVSVALAKRVMTNEAASKSFIDVEPTASGYLVSFDSKANVDTVSGLLSAVGPVAPLARPGDVISEGLVSDMLILLVQPAQMVEEAFIRDEKALCEGVLRDVFDVAKERVGGAVKALTQGRIYTVSTSSPHGPEASDADKDAHNQKVDDIAAKHGGKVYWHTNFEHDQHKAERQRRIDAGETIHAFSSEAAANRFRAEVAGSGTADRKIKVGQASKRITKGSEHHLEKIVKTKVVSANLRKSYDFDAVHADLLKNGFTNEYKGENAAALSKRDHLGKLHTVFLMKHSNGVHMTYRPAGYRHDKSIYDLLSKSGNSQVSESYKDDDSLLTQHYGQHIGLNADWNSKTWHVKGDRYLGGSPRSEGYFIHDNEDDTYTLAHHTMTDPHGQDFHTEEMKTGTAEEVHQAAQGLIANKPANGISEASKSKHALFMKDLYGAGMDGNTLFKSPGEGWSALHGALAKHNLALDPDELSDNHGEHHSGVYTLHNRNPDGSLGSKVEKSYLAVYRTSGVGDGEGVDHTDVPMKGKHEFIVYPSGKAVESYDAIYGTKHSVNESADHKAILKHMLALFSPKAKKPIVATEGSVLDKLLKLKPKSLTEAEVDELACELVDGGANIHSIAESADTKTLCESKSEDDVVQTARVAARVVLHSYGLPLP